MQKEMIEQAQIGVRIQIDPSLHSQIKSGVNMPANALGILGDGI